MAPMAALPPHADGCTPPSPADRMRRFIETQDPKELEKPITATLHPSYAAYLTCMGLAGCLSSSGLSALFCPISVFAPCLLASKHSLRLDSDAVHISSAANDFCCHVAHSLKSIPLDKVQDVELQESCIHTCFGLKQVNVQTAGQGGGAVPELAAAFLAEPEQVREAVRLAVQLYRQRAFGSPGQMPGMARCPPAGGVGTSAPSPLVDTMLARLTALEALVARGALSAAEADELKVSVLSLPTNPCGRLAEAAELRDRGTLTGAEFAAIKANLVAALRMSSTQH